MPRTTADYLPVEAMFESDAVRLFSPPVSLRQGAPSWRTLPQSSGPISVGAVRGKAMAAAGARRLAGKPSVGVIGAGRVGAVIGAALRSVGYPLVAVAGESDASRTRIETLLPGVRVDKPTAVSKAAGLLLLTVPDDTLDNVVRMLVASRAIRSGQIVVHTSGRHGLRVLEPARAIGAHGIALHPAMTFTGTDLDLARLAGCTYGVTNEPEDHALVETLVADLGGNLVTVEEGDRELYHAALAHGSNHLVTLVSQAMDLLRSAGAQDPALILRPLMTAALDNALAFGDAALTGPIVRGDLKTVRAHLRSLAGMSPSMLEAYVTMARATAAHAIADGRLQQRRAAALLEALDGALAESKA